MKHKEFLSSLSNDQIKQMINDVNELHHETGMLPKESLVRELSKIVSDDYNLPFNLTVGENALMWEVYKRFNG